MSTGPRSIMICERVQYNTDTKVMLHISSISANTWHRPERATENELTMDGSVASILLASISTTVIFSGCSPVRVITPDKIEERNGI